MNHLKHCLLMVLILLISTNYCAYAQNAGTASNPRINFSNQGKVWTGMFNDDWTAPVNWSGFTPPSENDNIFIPAGCTHYPKLTSAKKVKAIYIAAGASLGGQQYLTADAWYTTIDVPANCWVSLCAQLKQTYSGDFFTAEQGGTYTGPFAPASYNPTEGNTGNNRTYPYAIYQRLFSTLIKNQTTANYALWSYNINWSEPANALNTLYQTGEGLQVWAPSEKDTTSFHFPSNANSYDWYGKDGNIVTNMAAANVNHNSANQPAFQADANGTMNVVITRNINNDSASTTPMFAVGNPTFGYMDIYQFLKENATNKNITPYLYAHTNSTQGNRNGAETVYYYNHNHQQKLFTVTGVSETDIPTGPVGAAVTNNKAYIKPGHSFRVMAGALDVTCAEPLLLGEYNCTSVIPNGIESVVVEGFYGDMNGDGIKEFYPMNHPDILDTICHFVGFMYDNYTQTKTASSKLSITPTDNAYEVILNNFVGQGSVKGTVNPANKTITIKGGSQVHYSDTTWKSDPTVTQLDNFSYQKADTAIWYLQAVDPQTKNIHLSACDIPQYATTFFVSGVQTKKADNVSKNNDLIIKYTISGNNVSFSCDNDFAIYPDDLSIFYILRRDQLKKPTFCATWNCFDSYTGQKNITTGATLYANQALFGTYQYTAINNTGNANISFTIRPIVGLYDIVEISGIYPNTTTQQAAIGIVNGNNIYIPAGQCVSEDTSILKQHYCLYGADSITPNNQRGSLNMVLENNNSIKIVEHLQVSHANHNTPRYYTTKNHSCPRTAQWDGKAAGEAVTTVGTNRSKINICYKTDMFEANPETNAPQYTSSNITSNVVNIAATQNDVTINTIVIKSDNGNNGYNYKEDAAMIEMSDNAFALATVADNQLVAVNTINDTTRLQLYLQNNNGNVEITINNAQALGNNVRLYDAADNTYTPLNGNKDTFTINMNTNDSPLRLSLVWDAPIISGHNLPLTDNTVEVYNPQTGTIQVSADNMESVKVFNAAGTLVNNRSSVDNNTTTFNNLPSGIYMVEVTINNSKVVRKIDVK